MTCDQFRQAMPGVLDMPYEIRQEYTRHFESCDYCQEEVSTEDLLKSLSNCDDMLDHDDNCGHCFRLWCMAEAARQLVAEKNYDLDAYTKLDRQLWEDGKYFKLYQEEKAAGRDPNKAFEERQWEM